MLKPMCSTSPDPPQTVSELIDPTTRTCNRPILMQHFVKPDVDVIMSIPLSFRVQQDFWAWHYDKRGIFSVRSAYRMLSAIKFQREDWLEHRTGHSNIAAYNKSWSLLWKVKVPSKVRLFAWRLAHTSIPTGTLKHERKMAGSPVCSICNDALDTWRHSLMNCRMARCVWALADANQVEQLSSSMEPNATLWLFSMMEVLSHASFVKLAVTLWAIWWARRQAIHEGNFQSPYATDGFV